MRNSYSIRFFFLIILLPFISRAQYSWNNVGSGMNLPVQSLSADTINHVVYAGGLFTSSGITPVINIAKWNGTSWTPVGGGIISGTGVSALLVDGPDLYAGGTFTNIGGVLSQNIAKWDGTSWSPLGSGLSLGGLAIVNSMTMYQGELYAGGLFALSGTTLVSNIAHWDGTSWQPLGSGTNGEVKTLCIYGTDLYAGGTFTNAGGIPVNNIARWDGTGWSDVGGGVSYTGATTVSTLTVYSGELYAGGKFTNAGATPVQHLAKWNGTGWTDVGGGAGSYTGATTVSTLTVFEGELIIGGSMDSLGSLPVNNIGKWDGSSFSVLGTGTNNAVSALTALHDTLYAGGSFTAAGGTSAPFIAQWKPYSESLTTGESDHTLSNENLVYPNPATDILYLKNTTPGLSFVILDLNGREILRRENIGDHIALDRTRVSNGLYLYKLLKGNEVICRGKLSLF
ncbi:MAG: T9SS type A sorting domain-containing protein [Bacteroidia bacterium]